MRRSRVTIALATAAMLLAFGAVGGVAAAGGTGGTLEGPTWVLTSYDKGGTMTNVPADVYADATFKGGRVNGSAGCNVFNGSYTASGSALTFGPLATTMMACGPAQSDVETAYLAALGKSATYTATADTLTIYDSSGTELLRYTAASPTAITGVTWHLLGYNNGKQAVVSVISGTDPTATFGTDGTVSGNATCNQFTGPYTTTDATIKIGPLASTLMACADPAQQDQETLYLAALQKATTFQVQGKHLEMRDDSGALQVDYTSTAPTPAATVAPSPSPSPTPTPAASMPAATPMPSSAPQPPTTTSDSTSGGSLPSGLLLLGAAAVVFAVLVRRRGLGDR